MKLLLIGINILLMLLLAGSGWSLLTSTDASGGLEVGKKKHTKTPVAAAKAPAAPIPLKSSEEAGKIIVEKNVFDPQRCSGAVGSRGGSTLTLVGIYQVGDSAGIIVLVKNNTPRRQNFMMGRPNNNQNNQKTQAVKQYYRIGDTLPNGYTLSAVEETKAILTRGSAKMSLDLAKASENAVMATRSGGNRRTNPFGRMVQLLERSVEQQQQQNMMNMMRFQQTENILRNQQRSTGTPQRGGSSNSRNRSR